MRPFKPSYLKTKYYANPYREKIQENEKHFDQVIEKITWVLISVSCLYFSAHVIAYILRGGA